MTKRGKKLKNWKDIEKIGTPVTYELNGKIVTDYFIPSGYHGLNYQVIEDEIQEYFAEEAQYEQNLKNHVGTIVLIG